MQPMVRLTALKSFPSDGPTLLIRHHLRLLSHPPEFRRLLYPPIFANLMLRQYIRKAICSPFATDLHKSTSSDTQTFTTLSFYSDISFAFYLVLEIFKDQFFEPENYLPLI